MTERLQFLDYRVHDNIDESLRNFRVLNFLLISIVGSSDPLVRIARLYGSSKTIMFDSFITVIFENCS